MIVIWNLPLNLFDRVESTQTFNHFAINHFTLNCQSTFESEMVESEIVKSLMVESEKVECLTHNCAPVQQDLKY